VKLIETVYNLDEFLSKVDKNEKLHYELFYQIKPFMGNIDKMNAILKIYGLNKGRIIVYEEIKVVSWESGEIKEIMREENLINYNDAMWRWVKRKWEEFSKKAEELGATKGNYSFVEG
jgi:hypothetical protein